MRRLLPFVLLLGLSDVAMAKRVDFSDCSKASRQKIIAGVDWLVAHLADLDRLLGQGGLANWSGGSRDRFANRLLKKKLRFSCHTLCELPRFKQKNLGTWTLPIAHGARIPICTSKLELPEQTAAVIAHGLGHLVWINAHRKSCHERCLKPRLGTSLMHAVYHAAQGTQYDSAQCLAHCGPIPAGSSGTPTAVPAENSFEVESPPTASPESR